MTVEVYIIDTTSFMTGFPISAFVEPYVPGLDFLDCKSYSYLVKHKGSKPNRYDKLLFDLGVRKDWGNYPEPFVTGVKAIPASIVVEKDVATILRENGQDLSEIGAIIWSHWHFDHSGDPQTFPTTTDLIVGPGFRANVLPGYPTDKDSHADERAWRGRELHEIDFAPSAGPGRLKVGGFEAYDFYGDGSFYLLNSPGHAVGHMSALARTSADPPTFILLGGDIAHQCGQFRPTQYNPLPENISPNPLADCKLSVCPGRIFLSLHHKKDSRQPFFIPVRGMWHHDPKVAKDTIDMLIEADAHDHIFPVLAHDMSLVGVVDFYPKPANEWMAKGWKEKSRWGFLGQFKPAKEVRGSSL